MAQLSITRANRIISHALAEGRRRGFNPLGVCVLDNGGSLKAFQLQDGASNSRFEIARGKAQGALAIGRGSRALHDQAIERPHFLIGLCSVIPDGVVPVPGGVIAKTGKGEIICVVGISGDGSDNDEICAVAAIEAVNLVADTG
jgi:uncharacterized protein GlcG (DUF336 family)